jgi:hypothetical protein
MDDSANTAEIITAMSRQQKLRDSSQASKDFSINIDDFLSKVSCSKILVFSNNSIIVLLSKISQLAYGRIHTDPAFSKRQNSP